MSARSCFDLFLSALVRSVLYNNFSLIPFIWFVSTLETKSTFEFFQSFLLLDLGFASTILSFMAGGGGLSSISPLTVSWPSRSPQLLARSGLAWPKGRREFVSSLLTILLTFLLGLYHLTMWATTLTSPLFSLRSRWLSHFRWERVCKRSLLVIISGPESRVIQTTILQPTKLIIPEHVTCKSSPSCLYWPIQFRHVTSSVILRVTLSIIYLVCQLFRERHPLKSTWVSECIGIHIIITVKSICFQCQNFLPWDPSQVSRPSPLFLPRFGRNLHIPLSWELPEIGEIYRYIVYIIYYITYIGIYHIYYITFIGIYYILYDI